MNDDEKMVIDSILNLESKAQKLIDEANKAAQDDLSTQENRLQKARERDFRDLADKEKMILANFEKDKTAILTQSEQERAKREARLLKLFEKNFKAGQDALLKVL